MAGENGAATDRLRESLRRHPYRYDFFQLVRRVECARSDRPRVGSSQRLADDPLRFCQEPSLAFAPSAISGFDDSSPDSARLFVSFMGLLGPNGPMPLHITEYARDRERNHDDPTLARFLDIFNHRMVSLFYRAWAVNQKTVSYERRHDDRFSGYLASLFGTGMESLRSRDAVPDEAKIFFSGFLACPTRHAEGLESILRQYFQMPTKVLQFVGQWMEIPVDARCLLGRTRNTATLGISSIVGGRIWECQQKFRIRFGPLDMEQFRRMLPGGSSQERLDAWVRNYLGRELSYDVQLVLRAREIPRTLLGRQGELGWSTWVASHPILRDVDDLIFSPPQEHLQQGVSHG